MLGRALGYFVENGEFWKFNYMLSVGEFANINPSVKDIVDSSLSVKLNPLPKRAERCLRQTHTKTAFCIIHLSFPSLYGVLLNDHRQIVDTPTFICGWL